MGKLTKKIVIYLDQNFLSEMAKVDSKITVNPHFKAVFKNLHQGFVDEKLLVPRSFFHDIETSLAPGLKNRIWNYQGYLGQVKLKDKFSIDRFQIVAAAKAFLDMEPDEAGYKIAFRDNPDQRTKQFDIRVNVDWSIFNYQSDRLKTAQQIDVVRQKVISDGVTYEEQLRRELDAQVIHFLQNKMISVGWLFDNDYKRIEDFAHSEHFRKIPNILIFSQMWSKIFVHYRNRKIRSSDATDVDIIATYLPYVDVVATDSFMADLVKSLKLNTQYKTQIFTANIQGLIDFNLFLENYLSKNSPVNKPITSIFILSDETIKQKSREFFQNLGSQIIRCENQQNSWVELYGFDDGYMPECYHEEANIRFPFYGLQEIKVIKIDPNKSLSQVLEICRNKVRSDKFILISSYQNLPDDFVANLIDCCNNGKVKILNWQIYNKTT